MKKHRHNYVIYLFFNGMSAGYCIDFDHAIWDIRWLFYDFIEDYNLPITIVDDSNKYEDSR